MTERYCQSKKCAIIFKKDKSKTEKAS